MQVKRGVLVQIVGKSYPAGSLANRPKLYSTLDMITGETLITNLNEHDVGVVISSLVKPKWAPSGFYLVFINGNIGYVSSAVVSMIGNAQITVPNEDDASINENDS